MGSLKAGLKMEEILEWMGPKSKGPQYSVTNGTEVQVAVVEVISCVLCDLRQ